MGAISPKTKGILFALTTAFFWGFLAIALKVSAGILEPVTIVWFRFLLAFLVLFMFFAVRKPAHLSILAKPPVLLIVASIGLAINYLGFLYGVKLTTPGTAQVVIQLGPISLGLVGFFFFREKISIRQGFGFLLAGIGLFLFYNENVSNMTGDENLFNMGILWVVIAAMAWVVYATLQKTLTRTYPAQQLNLIIFGLPAILYLPFVNLSGFRDLTSGEWLLMIYLGMNTLIAYGSLAMAFKYLEASKISIIVTMNPILTFIIMGILAWMEVAWIEPERLSGTGIAAAMLVIAGTMMAVARARKAAKKEVTQILGTKKDDTMN